MECVIGDRMLARVSVIAGVGAGAPQMALDSQRRSHGSMAFVNFACPGAESVHHRDRSCAGDGFFAPWSHSQRPEWRCKQPCERLRLGAAPYRALEGALEACGRLWAALDGSGRGWKALQGSGGLWRALDGAVDAVQDTDLAGSGQP